MWEVRLLVLSFASFVLGKEIQPLERRANDADLFKPVAKGPAADLFMNSSIHLSALFSGADNAGALFSRAQTCAYPVPCQGNLWCCPAGSKCCSTILECCPVGSECRPDAPGGGGCCPDTAQTCGGKVCADSGSVCCTDYVCPAGSSCNEKGGQHCCEKTDLHCNNACCPEGSACATIAGYCSSIRPTSSLKPTSTRSRTMASTVASVSVSLTTSVSTSKAALTSSTTASATESAACDPGSQRRDLQGRRITFPKSCPWECDPSVVGGRIPVLEIPTVPGETDQLVYSMCYGMTERVKSGSIRSGLADGEDILIYQGKRNQVVDCEGGGFCRDLTQAAGTVFQCDEYPPAKWNPPKGPQTRWCVPRYQNSGTQGPLFGLLKTTCNLQIGDPVKIRIKGGCKWYNFPKKRDVLHDASLLNRDDDESPTTVLHRRADIQLSSSNATLRNPLGDGSVLYVAVDIDELANGHYEFRLNFDGKIDNATIMNRYGDEYATTVGSPDGETTLSFDISDGSNLPAALIAWTSKAVNVSYAGMGKLLNGTSSASAAGTAVATASKKSGSGMLVVGSWGALGMVLFLLSVVLLMFG